LRILHQEMSGGPAQENLRSEAIELLERFQPFEPSNRTRDQRSNLGNRDHFMRAVK
jgi:hypothetical protein